MIEQVLSSKHASVKVKITVKSAIAVLLIALAVGLPQLVHMTAGAEGGAKWLPMYLPVLLGGCLLGAWWGLGIGVASPFVSFAVTSALGNAMPAAERLPFMIAELTVFAVVSGAFSQKILQNKWIAFPAVLLAQVAGRATFITLVAMLQGAAPFSVQAIWAQIQTGLIGVLAQAVIVPLLVIGLATLIKREQK